VSYFGAVISCISAVVSCSSTAVSYSSATVSYSSALVSCTSAVVSCCNAECCMFLIMPLFPFFSVAYVGSTTACPLQAPSAALIIVSTILSFCLELTYPRLCSCSMSGFVQHALVVWFICLFLAGEEPSIAGGQAGQICAWGGKGSRVLVFVCSLTTLSVGEVMQRR